MSSTSPEIRPATCSQFTRSQLRQAYGVCSAIAREQAKNFYYAFLALPADKRNALCAVYAFMRHADDISDEPNGSNQARRAKLDAWLNGLHKAAAGAPTDDPVLIALCDAQHRFQIPMELFEKLVLGATLDLDATANRDGDSAGGEGNSQIRYRTFAELYGYCYHVASVVGLVCIHIFGYSDPRAEQLAERCGIAFQLTNIIRDVPEDAAMGRVYLPVEDLDKSGVAPQEITVQGLQDAGLRLRLRKVLEFEANRAREYYQSGRDLIPLVDDDSQPALWVLVEIYSRLLEKITARQYDVFDKKIALSTPEKVSVLWRGLVKRMLA